MFVSVGLVSYQRDSSRGVPVFAVILSVAVSESVVVDWWSGGCPYVAGVPGVVGFSALPGLSTAKETLTLLVPLFWLMFLMLLSSRLFFADPATVGVCAVAGALDILLDST